jgi:hypothetical protein
MKVSKYILKRTKSPEYPRSALERLKRSDGNLERRFSHITNKKRFESPIS